MGERLESTEMKRNMNPRAVIDTSPPFESVKEAVDRFGGSGPWVPHHLLRLPPLADDPEVLMNLDKMEEAVRFERDLMVKEKEALDVLKEVEAAKRYVEGLKLNLTTEEAASSSASPVSNSGFSSPSSGRLPGFWVQSPGNVLMELNQAKEDLDKMSSDLSVIRSSVESLNRKVTDERQQLGKSECMDDDDDGDDVWDLSFESEQFKKMAEASSYEVMKAALEIERTKESMKMAEMRLAAAKKMEEAAKAMEAIAIAQRKALLRNKHFSMASPTKGTTIPYDKPHKSLTPKAQQVEDHCKTKFVDPNVEVVKDLKRQGHNNNNNNNNNDDNNNKHKEEVLASEMRTNGVLAEFKDPTVKEPNTPKQRPVPVFGSTMSIGDVLNKRVSPTGDVAQRQHVSFSQMLRGQSGAMLGPPKSPKDGSAQRKKFGFIQVPLAKQNKKRSQAMNSLV